MEHHENGTLAATNGRKKGSTNGRTGDGSAGGTNEGSQLNGNGGSVLTAFLAVIANVAGVGHTLATISMAALHAILDPLIQGGRAIVPMARIPKDASGGRKGAIPAKEVAIFRSILTAARAMPDHFGVVVAGNKKVPLDVDQLTEDLDRYELLRTYAAVSRPLQQAAARLSLMLGASLRATLKPQYQAAKVVAKLNQPLAEKMDEVFNYYMGQTDIRQAGIRRAAATLEQAQKDAAAATRDAAREAKKQNQRQARQQRRALRGKKT